MNFLWLTYLLTQNKFEHIQLHNFVNIQNTYFVLESKVRFYFQNSMFDHAQNIFKVYKIY